MTDDEQGNQMTDIDLNITIEETNLILGALGEQPFAKVFGLVAKIQRQAQQQLDDGETVGAQPDDDDPTGGLDGG